MQRFKNILLVYDGRESGQSTLARAIDLATRNRAQLTVIEVINQIPHDYRMLITSLPPREIMETVVREHTLLLEKYIARFPESSGIRHKVLIGKEFVEIIKEVLRNNHDLVIKTARSMGGAIGMLFGTTAMQLAPQVSLSGLVDKAGTGAAFWPDHGGGGRNAAGERRE